MKIELGEVSFVRIAAVVLILYFGWLLIEKAVVSNINQRTMVSRYESSLNQCISANTALKSQVNALSTTKSAPKKGG